MRHNTLDSAMGGGKSHYSIVYIIILVHPSALPERVQWRKYIKYFIPIQHLAFFLPQENTTQDSLPLQVKSHPTSQHVRCDIGVFCLVLKKVYRC